MCKLGSATASHNTAPMTPASYCQQIADLKRQIASRALDAELGKWPIRAHDTDSAPCKTPRVIEYVANLPGTAPWQDPALDAARAYCATGSTHNTSR